MHRSTRRSGMTLLELVLILALSAAALLITIPRMHDLRQRAAVRGAVADVVATLAGARQMAVARGRPVVVVADEARAALRVIGQADTIAVRPLGAMFGVTLWSSRDSLAYDARGLAIGASNLTFAVRRGTTADTIVVSRLGRVRW